MTLTDSFGEIKKDVKIVDTFNAKILVKPKDADWKYEVVKCRDDILKILNCSASSCAKICVAQNIVGFYNFDKLSEYNEITASMTTDAGYDFFVGDVVFILCENDLPVDMTEDAEKIIKHAIRS